MQIFSVPIYNDWVKVVSTSCSVKPINGPVLVYVGSTFPFSSVSGTKVQPDSLEYFPVNQGNSVFIKKYPTQETRPVNVTITLGQYSTGGSNNNGSSSNGNGNNSGGSNTGDNSLDMALIRNLLELKADKSMAGQPGGWAILDQYNKIPCHNIPQDCYPGQTDPDCPISPTAYRRYWGVLSTETADNTQILGLNSEMSTTKDKCVEYVCEGGKHFYYAYPEEWGRLENTTINGLFWNGWVHSKITINDIDGNSVPLNVYRSENLLHGKVVVHWQ